MKELRTTQFIEPLEPQDDKRKLEDAYKQMRDDELREGEALEWAEATIDDISENAY